MAVTQFAWRIFAGGLSAASAIVVSAGLGLVMWGTVATSLGVLIGVSVAAGGGFAQAAAYLSAREPSAARAILTSGAGLAGVTSLVAIAIMATLVRLFSPSLPVSWWAVFTALPFIQIGQLGLGVEQGLGRTKAYLVTYVAQPVALFAISVGAVLLHAGPDSGAWTGALIAAPFAVQAMTIVALWNRLPATKQVRAPLPLLAYSARLYPSALAQFLTFRLDLILVGGFLGASQAALYSLALNGLDGVSRLGHSAAALLYPQFSISQSSAEAIVVARKSALRVGLLSGILTLLLSVIALGFSLRGSEEVRIVGLLLAILSLGSASFGAWTILAAFLSARNRLESVLRVTIVMVGTAAPLYLLLIPRIGMWGGAIGTTAGFLTAAILAYAETGRTAQPQDSKEPSGTLGQFGQPPQSDVDERARRAP